jgi:radical SAM superfamily enzyme YgiQ (UPF0313 family)
MRILLVNPRYRASFWTLTGAIPITQRPGLMTNLALATVAALTPDDIEVEVVDEGVDRLDFDTPCDLVGITGYVTQRARMIEIAEAFRDRGVPVAIGGPYASLSPGVLRPYADVLFLGEAEETWPAFIEDFRRGAWNDEYAQVGNVDMASSPSPRIGALRTERYYMGAVQTSRGCPFECEFCDVIVYLGRRQRYKNPEQVVKELANLYDAGQRQVFLADDNFTAHRGRAADMLRAIAAWNAAQPERTAFNTQVSIDVARDGDEPLLDLCVEAGLSVAFVGVETPSEAALLEVKKHQNVRYDLLSHVRKLQSHGIVVQAGMIVGFDSDGRDVFGAQYEFAQQAGTTMISLGTLNAPEGTPLEARLLAQGRLRDEGVDDVYASTNIIPKQMTTEQLTAGTRWLMNKLYDPAAFVERAAGLADQLPTGAAARPLGRDGAVLWDRISQAYAHLGPELEQVPRLTAGLFRGKELSHLATSLIFYCHVVRMLRSWNVWDPELARASEPVW